MDKIKQLLENQIKLAQSVNAQLTILQEDYRTLLQKLEGKPGGTRPDQVIEVINYDLRVINTRLQAELQLRQAEILELEIENERLRFIASSAMPAN